METWEYLILALPEFRPASTAKGQSESVMILNEQGQQGWEAVGMTALGDGTVAVLLKRPSGSVPASDDDHSGYR